MESPAMADLDLGYLSSSVYRSHARHGPVVEMVVEKFTASLYNALGIFLPLIAVNCASSGFLFRSGKGVSQPGGGDRICLRFRRRLVFSPSFPWPPSVKSWPIQMSRHLCADWGLHSIITGLMAIAFMSFMGIKI